MGMMDNRWATDKQMERLAKEQAATLAERKAAEQAKNGGKK